MENDEKQEEKLSKEEILEKSRKENKHGDERETQALYKAGYLASSVGLLLNGVITLVLAIYGKHSFEMNTVIFAILGTMYTVFGIKATKRKQLFLATGIICSITSVVTFVAWVLEMCGKL